MKRAVIGCIVALGLVVGGGAGAAFAGETNGNGDPIPGAHKASSACAFSGQDLPDAEENQPPEFNDDVYTRRPRSELWAVRPSRRKALFPSPGVACRGNVEFGGCSDRELRPGRPRRACAGAVRRSPGSVAA